MNIEALPHDMPEVLKGALFARYSRSDKGWRELYRSEFAGTDKAARLYSRVVEGYGDSSVAELGTAHVALEGISILAALYIERSRVGLSFCERSTRYVDVSDAGFYNVEDKIIKGKIERHIATYAEKLKEGETALKALHDLPPHLIRSRACDEVRHILPLATLTNLGIVGNGQAFGNLVVRCLAAPYAEVREIGERLMETLKPSLGVFMRHVYNPDRLNEMVEYSKTYDDWRDNDAVGCGLIFQKDGNPHAYLESWKYVGPCIEEDIIKRPTRHYKLPRRYESIVLNFAISASIGAWRDLRRHRFARISQSCSPFSNSENDYSRTLADQIQWTWAMNFREYCHIAELRSQQNGHPEYRNIIKQMHIAVTEKLPELAKQCIFVNIDDDMDFGRSIE